MNKYVRADHEARAAKVLRIAKEARSNGNIKAALMAMNLYHGIVRTWLTPKAPADRGQE